MLSIVSGKVADNTVQTLSHAHAPGKTRTGLWHQSNGRPVHSDMMSIIYLTTLDLDLQFLRRSCR